MNAIEDILHNLKANEYKIHDDCIALLPKASALCNRLDTIIDDTISLIERETGVLMDLFGVSPFVTVVGILSVMRWERVLQTVDQLIYSGYETPLVSNLVNRIVDIVNMAIHNNTLSYVQPILVALNVSFLSP